MEPVAGPSGYCIEDILSPKVEEMSPKGKSKAKDQGLSPEDREAYQQCMKDICKDIAITLPAELPLYRGVNHTIPLIDDKKIIMY
jgi:hypothetical protein